ncbi:MAG: MBOAT family protein, partial [Gemmatimonadota bacterium]|nr:MBOAT family protein [Gemmatimonadota bacterium]
STLIDYWAGLRMGQVAERSRRRRFLAISMASNLGLLFGFKYLNFFNESTRAVFNQFNFFYGVPEFDILLPVGISFYTFQTLSYSIDVYRGRQEPERHLGIFALYVSFFPQLVAGPIERSTHLLPQFRERQGWDQNRALDGFKLILWGFFKKLVIADRLAIYVNEVYNNPDLYSGGPVILATYFFAFQIYCDFSAYSDIAIGTAQVMGYDLMENFRRPYFSKSIAEFWTRWHISLSSWFRDYLYIPLGGNRVPRPRWFLNLFVVFLVSGLWHGANWTFVVWGALHGTYLIVGILTHDARSTMWDRFGGWHSAPPDWWRGERGIASTLRLPAVRQWISVLATFHLVLFAWVFFRANSIGDAFTILRRMLVWDPASVSIQYVALDKVQLVIAVVAIAFMELVHLLERRSSMRQLLSGRPLRVQWPFYYVLILSILLTGVFAEQEFIYFQF